MSQTPDTITTMSTTARLHARLADMGELPGAHRDAIVGLYVDDTADPVAAWAPQPGKVPTAAPYLRARHA